MNELIRKTNQIRSYLTEKYDLDKTTIKNFLAFYKKSTKEKLGLYKQDKYKVENFIDTNDSTYLPFDDDNLENNFNDEVSYNFPDLIFENEMLHGFEQFKIQCLDDKMIDLYYNIQIDDFYRLFAPYYNPIF